MMAMNFLALSRFLYLSLSLSFRSSRTWLQAALSDQFDLRENQKDQIDLESICSTILTGPAPVFDGNDG